MTSEEITARCEKLKDMLLDAAVSDDDARAAEAVCGVIDVIRQLALEVRSLVAAVPLE